MQLASRSLSGLTLARSLNLFAHLSSGDVYVIELSLFAAAGFLMRQSHNNYLWVLDTPTGNGPAKLSELRKMTCEKTIHFGDSCEVSRHSSFTAAFENNFSSAFRIKITLESTKYDHSIYISISFL